MVRAAGGSLANIFHEVSYKKPQHTIRCPNFPSSPTFLQPASLLLLPWKFPESLSAPQPKFFFAPCALAKLLPTLAGVQETQDRSDMSSTIPGLTVSNPNEPSGFQTPYSATLKSDDGATADEKAPHKESGETAIGHAKGSKEVDGTDEETGTVGTHQTVDDESRYVTGYKLVLIFIGMLLSIFLIALDQTIVATAIPRIASEFNALEQVTWIASAYFLTQCSFMLSYGQVLRVATTKYVYLFAIVLFEVGSVICGAAQSIDVLIFGRAFAGVGAAGIFVSCLSIIAQITRLEQRPMLFGLFGGIFALSSVVGPLMGGAFTDNVSWRWCFYINLPFGVITIVSIIFFIKPEHSFVPRTESTPTWKRILRLDWLGTFLCVGMVTSLLLPLQWGGVTKPWTDASVIACFCVFGVLLLSFVGWEWFMGDKAMMPLTLFTKRTQIGACIEAFFVMLILLCAVYYLPLYYQSAEQHSAQRSGIDILVYMVCTVLGAAVAGGVINFTGRPLPFLVFSPFIAALGCGLIFWNLTTKPNSAFLFGMQVLVGFGVGGAMQNTIIAIQAEYAHDPEMVPQATSLVNFLQLVGGVIGISVAGTIFGNRLASAITKYAPNVSPSVATAARQSVSVIFTLQGADRAGVIHAYSEALGYVFIIGIPAGILGGLSGLLIKNFNLRKMGVSPGMAAAA